jgi:GMP synthase (glutamine-hydrolysing)
MMPRQKNGKPILAILHSETSTCGRIGQLLRAKGYPLDIRRPCLGEALPDTLDEHSGAMIFGGPMSANDTHAYLRSEIEFIAVPLKEDKPFLGICLGAQMLAIHLGGTVAGHPESLVEIGYYPLRPTAEGSGYGPWPSHVYHWHREGMSLPAETVCLASSDAYENQAIRYGTRAFGLQFHPEVTRLTMHRWTVIGAHRFDLPGAQPRNQHLEGQLLHDAVMKEWIDGFLDKWLSGSEAVHASSEDGAGE